jgi:hypothetical protein
LSPTAYCNSIAGRPQIQTRREALRTSVFITAAKISSGLVTERVAGLRGHFLVADDFDCDGVERLEPPGAFAEGSGLLAVS